MMDWNTAWEAVQSILEARAGKWRAAQARAFRDAFTEIDPQAAPVIASRTKTRTVYEADAGLRDFENAPLKEDVEAYFEREVLPHVPDAWIANAKTKTRYEVNFNRHFYRFTPPRPLSEIDADLKKAEEEIIRLLREVTA